MTVRRAGGAILPIFLACLTPTLAAAQTSGARLDMGAALASPATEIAASSFGVNLLARNDTGAAWSRLGLPALFTATGLNVMRYPGGEDADVYDWRSNRFNDRSGAMDGPPPQEFLRQVQKAVPNARMAFVVNLEQAFTDGFDEARLGKAADNAADWVRAVREAGLFVPWWEIGNESYLLSTRFTLTAEEYAHAVKVFSQRMRAADPRIRIGAHGPTGWESRGFLDRLDPKARERLRGDRRALLARCSKEGREECRDALNKAAGAAAGDADDPAGRWWPTLARVAGDAFDFAVLHHYEEIDGRNRTDTVVHGPKMQRQIESLRANLLQATGKPKGVALTEWNTNPLDDKTDLARRHTLFVAEYVIALAASGVEYAAFWPLRLDAQATKLRVPLVAEAGAPASAALAVMGLANQTLRGSVIAGSGRLTDSVYAVALRDGAERVVAAVNTANAPGTLRLERVSCRAGDSLSVATVLATAPPPPAREPLRAVQRVREPCTEGAISIPLPAASVRFIRIGRVP